MQAVVVLILCLLAISNKNQKKFFSSVQPKNDLNLKLVFGFQLTLRVK